MIHIENYTENWAKMFATEKIKILKAAGQWIESLEHVGSTAVPDLPAKPTIDICIGVTSLEKADHHILNVLEKLGYSYLPPTEVGVSERRYLQKLDANGNHIFHLHIVVIHSKLWKEYLGFRDYLITHPEDIETYATLKNSLKEKFSHDRKAYTDGKAVFIQNIIKKLI